LGVLHPKVVIFSSDHFIPSRSTASIYGISLVSKIFKSRERPPLIGVCGRLATVAAQRLFAEVPEVDFAVIGESDGVIGEVVADLLAADMEETSRRHGYVHTRTAPARDIAYMGDVNDVALPAFALALPSIAQYRSRFGLEENPLPFSLRTSFGCKFKCRFCAGVPHWLDYRKKSPDRVQAELDAFLNQLGDQARISFLEDEIFTRDPEHVAAITALLKERNIYLDGLYTHSTLLTPEIAADLCTVADRVFTGLDNADDQILRKMGKGQLLDTVLDAVEKAQAASLKVHLEWIIGTPEETLDTLVTSLSTIFNLLSTHAVESINTYVYCPHPGTDYTVNAKKYRMRVLDTFDGIQESGGYPAFDTANLTRNQIYTAYLMSQLVIAEVTAARQHSSIPRAVVPASRSELLRLFGMIGEGQVAFDFDEAPVGRVSYPEGTSRA